VERKSNGKKKLEFGKKDVKNLANHCSHYLWSINKMESIIGNQDKNKIWTNHDFNNQIQTLTPLKQNQNTSANHTKSQPNSLLTTIT